MKLELEIYGSLCATQEFRINGIDADKDDFGEHYDAGSNYADDYSCGNRVFEGKLATEEILSKYNISVSEYNLVVNQLQVGLSFGNCGLCS